MTIPNLVGGELFYSDNACNFQKVLKDAIATYGIPDKLYVNNGCSYSNEQLSMICVSLGILLLHTKVRDGASKGKVERYEASQGTSQKNLFHASGWMTVFITGLPARFVRIPPLPLTASAMMFPCNSFLQR